MQILPEKKKHHHNLIKQKTKDMSDAINECN